MLMIAYESDTWFRLGLGLTPILASLILFFLRKERVALYVLFFGSFILRLSIISLDPLHEWDERFHALVAKNMIENPFKPMLHLNPILNYDYKAWCCNHIWIHKQPLFLWQMSLSMKIFGVNEFAMRLPSAIMGAISVSLIYKIINFWTNNKKIAFISAFLFSINFFQLEMTSGRIGLDHNDIGFSFYVTASIWFFCKYLNKVNIKNALFVGVFVGLAVLIKWLPGILIFGGWGLYILLDKEKRTNISSYLHLVYSAIVSLVIFLPWQFYIMYKFPILSKWEYEFNRKHIFEALEGHAGSIFYHLKNVELLYGLSLIILILGIVFTFRNHKSKLTIIFFSMVAVIYSFFSIVATKMPAFTFPVSSIMIGIFSIGIFYTSLNVIAFFKLNKYKDILMFLIVCIVGYYVLNPIEIANYRSISNSSRNNKINNIEIFKNLDEKKNNLIINCNSFENIDLMFYKNVNAYHWYPPENELVELINKGYKISAFKSHGEQILPEYILLNSKIEILDFDLK